jgi:iron complex outermembrane recepter protein
LQKTAHNASIRRGKKMNRNTKIAKGYLWLGAASMGALLVAMPQVATAQNKPVGTDTIVVKGYRGSLIKSIREKRNNTSIVESVSAEEIGKLPDSSIAESLARLPGVAGVRVNGDVQVLNIRGTSPDFTVTTLNGRQQGSLGDGRGVEVDQYPSELLGGVVVYKTPDAAISGMGLSGTVDMRTVRPLSQAGRSVVINLRAETTSQEQLNPDVDKNGWRGSASYVNQFMDGKLGVAFGVSHMDSTSQIQSQKLWDWKDASDLPYGWEASSGNYLTGGTASQRAHKFLTGFQLRANSLNKVRDGAMGVVEFKPNDNSHTTLDLFYTKMKQTEIIRDVEVNTFWTNDVQAGLPLSSAVFGDFAGIPTVVGGKYVGMAPINNNQLNTRDDSVASIGINHKFKADIWDLEADLSYSKSEGDQYQAELFAGYGTGGARVFDTINFSIPQTGFVTMDPGLNYADMANMNLGDNAPWGGWGADGHIRTPHVEDSYFTFDFKGKTSLSDTFVGGIFKSVELGFGGWNHLKDKSIDEGDLFLKGRSTLSTNSNNRPTAPFAPYYIGTTNLDWGGWGGLAAFDIVAAANNAYTYRALFDSNHYSKDWNLSEDVGNLYTKFNIDTKLMGHRLSGNVGVQYVMTETIAQGVTIPSSGPLIPVATIAHNQYDDVLPSLNLAFDITNKHKLRFGLAKQMARPRTDDLRANFSVGLSGLSSQEYLAYGITPPSSGEAADMYYKPTGNGGNPYLEPWRATAYDVSYEWYLGKKSLIAVSGFYKDVDTYIYTDNVNDFKFLYIPNPLNRKIITDIGTYNTPQNGKGGYVKGIEVQGIIDLGEFVPSLEGFGVSGNYTQNWTDIRPNSSGNSSLPGFSGETYNATAFYEKAGFQARVSYSYRDPTYSDVAGLFGTRSFTSILENAHVDAQIGYEFQEGSKYEGLAITLQGYNITDEPYSTARGDSLSSGVLLPETYETYGAKYLLGVRYKF